MDEDGLGAGDGEFGGKVGELREDFVDETDLRGEGVGVDVFCEEAADIACVECQWEIFVSEPVRVLGWGREWLRLSGQMHT